MEEKIREHVRQRDDIVEHSTWPLDNDLVGKCYIASEIYYHLNGGSENWTVEKTIVEVPNPLEGTTEFTHWYLRDKETNEVKDITKEQFKNYSHGQINIPYEKGETVEFKDELSQTSKEIIEALS